MTSKHQGSPLLVSLLVAITLCTSHSVLAAPTIWHAGIQLEHVTYDEPGVIKEEGMLGGIFGQMEWQHSDKTTIQIFGSFVGGKLDYQTAPETGADLSSNNKNTIFDLRLTAGRKLGSQGHAFFAGFGYRHLEDKVPDFEEYVGYDRQQEYFYIPLGLTLKLPSAGAWSLSTTFEYDLFIKGQNDSEFVKLEQDDGYGCRALVTAQREKEESRFQLLRIQSYIQYWNVDQSDFDRGFFEPENDSLTIGIRLSAQL